MPRRVWTYLPGLGWETPNLLASIGAAVLAGGFALAFADILRRVRLATDVDVNPWHAPTLEWLPLGNFGTRSIPRIDSREPLWDHPELRQEVDAGQHYLPGLVTGTRETIVTSPRSARPEYILRLPGPSWLPFVAGVGTAAFFFLLTVKLFVPAGLAAAVTLFCLLRWAWMNDPAPGNELLPIGDGIRLPDAMTGPRSHAWWAMVVFLIVDGAILASLLFGWFYLGAGAEDWPPPGGAAPAIGWSALAALGWLAGSATIEYANRALREMRRRLHAAATALGIALLAGAFAAMAGALATTGVEPGRHAFGAMSHALFYWQAVHVAVAVLMGLFVLARAWHGLVDHRRRATFDHARLLVHYTAAQGVLMLLALACLKAFFGLF
jgi:cytochrome c oxidase subunit I+III